MTKLAIDRASIVFGKKKSGDFHSKSGDREIFIILSKIGRPPEKSGDLEALHMAWSRSQPRTRDDTSVNKVNRGKPRQPLYLATGRDAIFVILLST